jgi:RNA 2',3'-cyclic 3'-phosphodiesterase
MPELQRLFFALNPEAKVRAALVRAIPLPGPGGRLVPADNLHVTLAFLGSVDAGRIPELKQLAANVRGQSFTLRFERLEVWNRALVSIVPTHTPDALARLVAALSARLAPAGFQTEDRMYRPHVTVIRERQRGSGRREALIAPEQTSESVSAPIDWQVDDFVLMRSQPGPGGSRYVLLSSWPLIDAE